MGEVLTNGETNSTATGTLQQLQAANYPVIINDALFQEVPYEVLDNWKQLLGCYKEILNTTSLGLIYEMQNRRVQLRTNLVCCKDSTEMLACVSRILKIDITQDDLKAIVFVLNSSVVTDTHLARAY